MNNFIIFPNQLFYDLDHIKNYKNIYLVEEPRYFTDFKFHKLKLAYHRATMKKYFDHLKKNKFNIKYIEYNDVTDKFYKNLLNVTIIDPIDHKLLKKIKKIFNKNLIIIENLNFLVKNSELDTIKKLIYKNKRYHHDEFYKYQRKKLNILIDKKSKPVNNKWSFDSENRLKLPKTIKVPDIIGKVKTDKYIKEAKAYVNKNFADNYGSIDNFIYPIDKKSSLKWLHKFLDERLNNFGKYEDAVATKYPFVFHSVLSPMMNIGLLTDIEVVNISYKYYNDNNILISSFEGFIRQVIGWRNYVYTIYLLEGDKMYKSNILKHTNKITNSIYKKLWTGTTSIVMIDSVIEKIKDYAYAHHIERLMYLGNFLLLCQFNPKDVYKMFMEWTVDSYDWVMVPNVMGMSQYATSVMMTRPYFSSSNYMTKMSDYKRDSVFDALYYNFIDKHYNLLKSNYAYAQQIKHWDNKSDDERKEIKKIAKDFLNDL